MEWYRLYKESSGGLMMTKDEFDKLFYDYVDVADEYYCQGGYKSKNAKVLKLKMREFIDTVKSNVSRDYKHDDPDWERQVSMVFTELDDIIGDGNDDWIERKKRQLWYDFIAYKSLPETNTNESSEEPVDIKKLLKLNGVAKLPSGTEFKSNRISWSKRGGYAGRKTLDQLCDVLEDAGWKKGEWKPDGSPDGSWVSNSDSYTSPDGKMVMSYYSYYGATSRDNSYGFTFKLAESPVNESDEWDDWNNAEPMIYKYYADDPIPMDEFVDCVRTKEQELEDIVIQNSETYSSLPYGEAWKLFCDDICNGNSPEKELELDYYMNKTAKDKLPNDIKKYVVYDGFDALEFMQDIFNRVISVSKDPVEESSRFGFNLGDDVELKSDVEPNRFSDRGVVPAGTVGEVVSIDKPMPGVIKVKIEDGTVVSVAERKLKFAGTDNEPWEKYKQPEKPPREPSEDDLLHARPEWIYMEPPKPGYPKWTGD